MIKNLFTPWTRRDAPMPNERHSESMPSSMEGIFKEREKSILQILQIHANDYAFDGVNGSNPNQFNYPLEILKYIYSCSMEDIDINRDEVYLFKLKYVGHDTKDKRFNHNVLTLDESKIIQCFNWGLKYENVVCFNNEATKWLNSGTWSKEWKKRDVIYVNIKTHSQRNNCVQINFWIKANDTFSRKLGIECNDVQFPFNISLNGNFKSSAIKL